MKRKYTFSQDLGAIVLFFIAPLFVIFGLGILNVGLWFIGSGMYLGFLGLTLLIGEDINE